MMPTKVQSWISCIKGECMQGALIICLSYFQKLFNIPENRLMLTENCVYFLVHQLQQDNDSAADHSEQMCQGHCWIPGDVLDCLPGLCTAQLLGVRNASQRFLHIQELHVRLNSFSILSL